MKLLVVEVEVRVLRKLKGRQESVRASQSLGT